MKNQLTALTYKINSPLKGKGKALQEKEGSKKVKDHLRMRLHRQNYN